MVIGPTRLQNEMPFESIRRPGDFWAWTYFTLIPALFSNNGPCNADEMVGYGFNSSVSTPDVNLTLAERVAAKGCEDDTWPDGPLPGAGGGRPVTVEEQVLQMDVFDWSGGIQIRQQRVKSIGTSVEDVTEIDAVGCEAAFVGDYCVPELESDGW